MKSEKILIPAIAVMLSLLLTLSCGTRPETAPAVSVDSLNHAAVVMEALVEKGDLPCVSTLVIKDGEIIHRVISGMANIEEGRLLTDDAIFRIYSMTKPITTAALMILYDEGKFKLDDPVSMYIPEFENTKVYQDGEEVEQKEPFTIRQLLTHTAGFAYVFENTYVDSLYNNPGIFMNRTLKEMIAELAGFPLKHQPGSVMEYSVAIDVAGYLVEVLSSLTYDVFLQTRLFDPLKMEDTGFSIGEEDFDRLAMIYWKDEETGEFVPVPEMTDEVKGDVTLFPGGHGLVSTINDISRFGQMLLNGGELNGVRILEESTVKLIMSDQVPRGVSYKEGKSYGLGGEVDLETGTYEGRGYASTVFVVDPANHMVILMYTQYIPPMGGPLVDKYKQLIWNAIMD
jgi:CubicO group peptidase (beta-lactamase class C family)